MMCMHTGIGYTLRQGLLIKSFSNWSAKGKSHWPIQKKKVIVQSSHKCIDHPNDEITNSTFFPISMGQLTHN